MSSTIHPGKVGLSLKDIPNAILGVFGIRTEKEVPFQIIQREDPFEIRILDEHVEVYKDEPGLRKEAMSSSFDWLLGFIKGANQTKKNYAMTAPVFAEGEGTTWRTSFYITGKLSTVPVPSSPEICIAEVKRLKVAIIKFSGSAKDHEVTAKTEALKTWIAKQGLKQIGKVRFAQYDPPFAIPALRRNEIQISVE